MRAVPLWQPWATLVAIGKKRVETRDYPPSRFGISEGDEIAIYATKGLGDPRRGGLTEADLARLCDSEPFKTALVCYDVLPDDLPRGMVVCTCRLKRASAMTRESITTLRERHPDEAAFGHYELGRWAWVLDQARLLEPPLPGRPTGQGAFDWDLEAARQGELA